MRIERGTGYALYSLLERPLSLLFLFGAFAALVLPWAYVPDPLPPWLDQASSQAQRLAFEYEVWRSCIVLPLAWGFVLGGMTHEALQTGLSWMLPRYRTRLLPSTIVVIAVTALFTSIVVSSVLSTSAGMAAFGISTLSFAIGWRMFDFDASVPLRSVLALAVVTVVARPVYLVAGVNAGSAIIGMLALVTASFVLLTGFSDDVARRLALRPWRAHRGLQGFLEEHGTTLERPAPGNTGRRSLPQLIRAGVYESTAGARFARIQLISSQIILASVLGWIGRVSLIVGTVPMFLVAFSGSQLKDVFPYPLSRQKRADAFFASSLFDAVTMATVITIAIIALVKLGLWRDEPGTSIKQPADALVRLIFLFLFAPIVQFAQAHSPAFTRRGKPVSARQYITFTLAMLAWVGVGLSATFGFKHLATGISWRIVAGALLVCFVAVQSAFLISLRFYFARRDFR